MITLYQRKIFLAHIILAFGWSCLPGLLIYSILWKLPLYSRVRLGSSILVVIVLTFIAVKFLPVLRSLARKYWLILAGGSIILSFFGSAVLSFYPEIQYLFTPRHTLKIEVSPLGEGQFVEVRGLQTSLGIISYASFLDLTGWTRKENALIPISYSPPPLVWKGWVGNTARLHLRGERNVVVNVIWDGEPEAINFISTDGEIIIIQRKFVIPAWSRLMFGMV